MEPAERPRPRGLGRVLLASLALLVALPAFVAIPTSWRPLVIRLGSAALLAAGCARALSATRARVAPEISPLDAGPPRLAGPRIDARFTGLKADLVAGMRNRHYWDAILWPRLQALAGEGVPRPQARGGPGRRGPSRRVLAELVTRMERRA